MIQPTHTEKAESTYVKHTHITMQQIAKLFELLLFPLALNIEYK